MIIGYNPLNIYSLGLLGDCEREKSSGEQAQNNNIFSLIAREASN